MAMAGKAQFQPELRVLAFGDIQQHAVVGHRHTVVATFDLDDATVDEVRAAAADGSKVLRWFENEVRDAAGDVVAVVRKQVYVRRKRDRPAPAPAGG